MQKKSINKNLQPIPKTNQPISFLLISMMTDWLLCRFYFSDD